MERAKGVIEVDEGKEQGGWGEGGLGDGLGVNMTNACGAQQMQ